MAPPMSVADSPAGMIILLPPTDSLGAVVKEDRRMETQIVFTGQAQRYIRM